MQSISYADDDIATYHEPQGDQRHAGEPERQRRRPGRRALAAALVAAVAAGLVVAAIGARTDQRPADEPTLAPSVPPAAQPSGVAGPAPDSVPGRYEQCLRNGARTPDALEQWAETCRSQTVAALEAQARYEQCLRNAARTPDALDQWVGTCRNDNGAGSAPAPVEEG